MATPAALAIFVMVMDVNFWSDTRHTGLANGYGHPHLAPASSCQIHADPS
jgi:hypothetical protein